MKRLVAVLLLLAAALPAGSSKIIGNGGDVLVCPNRTPRVQLLDFAESRALRKRTIALWNPPGKNYFDKLQTLNENIEKRFPELANQLQVEQMYFEEKHVKEKDIELEDINDSYHKLRLPGCHVEQIANQSVPMFEDDPWFLINANLWDQLEEFDKAGLVMHEMIYRMGLRHGVEHSIGVRYLVSLLFQEKLSRVTDQQWIEAFMHSRVKEFETGGVRFPLFHGAAKNCEVVPGTIQCAGGDPEFKPAVITYNPDRSVLQVNFEGIGQQPFVFRNGDMTSSLYSEKVSFDWYQGKVRFIAEGRLMIRKTGAGDVMLADVRGNFDPQTGNFIGSYKYVKADMSAGQDKQFEGNLQQLFDQRPPALDVGSSRVDLQACKLEYSIVSPK